MLSSGMRAALCAVLLLLSSPCLVGMIVGRASVIDGDTIEIRALDYRISENVVYCDPQDRDRYGRIVAICRAWGEDLGAWMVGLGWALAYCQYSTRYVPAEDLARRRRAGLWAGEFTLPWEWRRSR
jgi:endonuclease YncB( thermonuclease family)